MESHFNSLPNDKILDLTSLKAYADEKINVTQIFSFVFDREKDKMLVSSILSFLAPLAIGQRAYVMVRCPSCILPSVRPSVRVLTFSLNIFFAETTYRILMKFHRNVPTMVLFRIS